MGKGMKKYFIKIQQIESGSFVILSTGKNGLASSIEEEDDRVENWEIVLNGDSMGNLPKGRATGPAKAGDAGISTEDVFERTKRLLEAGFEELAKVVGTTFDDEVMVERIREIRARTRAKLQQSLSLYQRALAEGGSEKLMTLARQGMLQVLCVEAAVIGELMSAAEEHALIPIGESTRRGGAREATIKIPSWAREMARGLAKEARAIAPGPFDEGDVAAGALRFAAFHQEVFLASPFIQRRSEIYLKSFEV